MIIRTTEDVAYVADDIRVCGTTGEVWRRQKDGHWKLVIKNTNNSGYLQISVKGQTWQTHKIVAFLFCDEKAGLPEYEVHHIDGDIYNNAPSNLEVILRSEHKVITPTQSRRPKPDGHYNIHHERSGKYTVSFTMYGKKSRKRTFDKLKAAVKWRDQARDLFERAYRGEIDWSEAPLKTRTNKRRTLSLDSFASL